MCKLYLYLCFMLMAFITTAQADDVVVTPIVEPSSNITLADALSLALNANPEIAVASREREAIEGVRKVDGNRINLQVTTNRTNSR